MRRRAEAIVVALILLVVGGLVAVFVGQVRDAAARIQCRNNLKQIGIGTLNYRDTYDYYPPGTVDNPALPPDKRLSWDVDLVPFLEGGIKLLLDKNLSWDAGENKNPKCKYPKVNDDIEEIGQVGWLTCPSNPNRASAGMPGVAHYVGVAGIGDDAAFLPVEDPRAGMFGYDRKTRLEDVKDGTGTTLLVMETARDNGPWTAGGRATVRGFDASQGAYLGLGGQFGSRHRGGVTNVVFADASVKALRAGMSAEMFEALATISGGEQAGPVDYE